MTLVPYESEILRQLWDPISKTSIYYLPIYSINLIFGAVIVCHVVWVIAFASEPTLNELMGRYWVSKLSQNQWVIQYLPHQNCKLIYNKPSLVAIHKLIVASNNNSKTSKTKQLIHSMTFWHLKWKHTQLF